jgi:hypothetical protein
VGRPGRPTVLKRGGPQGISRLLLPQVLQGNLVVVWAARASVSQAGAGCPVPGPMGAALGCLARQGSLPVAVTSRLPATATRNSVGGWAA